MFVFLWRSICGRYKFYWYFEKAVFVQYFKYFQKIKEGEVEFYGEKFFIDKIQLMIFIVNFCRYELFLQ